MPIAEKLFRIVSLMTLSLGFVVSVAGAKPQEMIEVTASVGASIQQILEDVKAAKEAMAINNSQAQDITIAQDIVR